MPTPGNFDRVNLGGKSDPGSYAQNTNEGTPGEFGTSIPSDPYHWGTRRICRRKARRKNGRSAAMFRAIPRVCWKARARGCKHMPT